MSAIRVDQRLIKMSHLALLESYIPLPRDLLMIIEQFGPFEHTELYIPDKLYKWFGAVYESCVICGKMPCNPLRIYVAYDGVYGLGGTYRPSGTVNISRRLEMHATSYPINRVRYG